MTRKHLRRQQQQRRNEQNRQQHRGVYVLRENTAMQASPHQCCPTSVLSHPGAGGGAQLSVLRESYECRQWCG
jgi:hypothetical protein